MCFTMRTNRSFFLPHLISLRITVLFLVRYDLNTDACAPINIAQQEADLERRLQAAKNTDSRAPVYIHDRFVGWFCHMGDHWLLR